MKGFDVQITQTNQQNNHKINKILYIIWKEIYFFGETFLTYLNVEM